MRISVSNTDKAIQGLDIKKSLSIICRDSGYFRISLFSPTMFKQDSKVRIAVFFEIKMLKTLASWKPTALFCRLPRIYIWLRLYTIQYLNSKECPQRFLCHNPTSTAFSSQSNQTNFSWGCHTYWVKLWQQKNRHLIFWWFCQTPVQSDSPVQVSRTRSWLCFPPVTSNK